MAYTSTLKKLAENLKKTYENTIFSNPTNVGDTREKEVIHYLEKIMAYKYGFQSGEVFDAGDLNSGQIDIIIYDKLFSTVFTDGTDKIFAPIESTYGIISIKSKMGIRELDNAINGIKKYDILKKPSVPQNTVQIMPDFALSVTGSIKTDGFEVQKNINCIFAFDTTIAIDTIIQKIKESEVIDLLVIPNKFCIIGRYRKELGLLDDNKKEQEYFVVENENSIGLFVLFLQVYLSKTRLVARDITNLILNIINSSNQIRLK